MAHQLRCDEQLSPSPTKSKVLCGSLLQTVRTRPIVSRLRMQDRMDLVKKVLFQESEDFSEGVTDTPTAEIDSHPTGGNDDKKEEPDAPSSSKPIQPADIYCMLKKLEFSEAQVVVPDEELIEMWRFESETEKAFFASLDVEDNDENPLDAIDDDKENKENRP